MKFFKIVLGSCLGAIMALFGIIFIGSLVISGIAASFTSGDSMPSKGLLKIDLSQALPEKTNNVKFSYRDVSTENIVGLHDLINSIHHAADDDRIKGIYLELTKVPSGISATTDIKDALLKFKESGKPIFSYSDYLGQKNYLLSSAADHIALNPNGMMYLKGIGIIMPFFKDALDKLGVSMQVFYAGNYKSASEPFRYNKMSDYNRTQLREYINDLYAEYLEDIKENRGISSDIIKELTNEDVFVDAIKAKELNLIDAILYKDQMTDLIKERLDYDEDTDIEYISINQYYKEAISSDFKIKDKVAIVYAEGNIVCGEDQNGTITYNRYAEILHKLRDDKKVKAVVLRVNSGGGDALTSDNLWREVELLKESGKSVVASFGSVAASGGYYIAAGADEIIANENTVTGSIGVVGMIPEAEKLFNDKLGIHFDTVTAGKHAAAYNIMYKLSPKQKEFLQENVQIIYDRFLQRVADGRNMDIEKVKEIAQGRIYTGNRALELGLIDGLGDLEDAVARAAELAKVEKYRTVEYPKFKEPFEQIIEDVMGGKISFDGPLLLSKDLNILSETERLLETWHRPMAKMPYTIVME